MKKRIKILSLLIIILGLISTGILIWICTRFAGKQRDVAIDEQKSSTETTEISTQAELTTQVIEQAEEQTTAQETESFQVGDIRIDEKTFADENFRKWIIDTYNLTGDVMKADQVQRIIALDTRGLEIKDLKGIEYFTQLNQLVCDFDQLSTEVVDILKCRINAYLTVPVIRTGKQLIFDYSKLPQWSTRICNDVLYYRGSDKKKNEVTLFGTCIVIPDDVSENPFFTYRYTDSKIIDVNLAGDEKQNTVEVIYKSYCQDYGWMRLCAAGNYSGTYEESKRLEAFMVEIVGDSNLNVHYSAYCKGLGWLPEVSNGNVMGTEGEKREIGAVKMYLSGADTEKYDLFYRVFIPDVGWLNWVKNGEETGVIGMNLRVEGIQIVLLEKGKNNIGDYGFATRDENLLIGDDTEEDKQSQRLEETEERITKVNVERNDEAKDLSVNTLNNIDLDEEGYVLYKFETYSAGKVTFEVTHSTREATFYMGNGKIPNIDDYDWDTVDTWGGVAYHPELGYGTMWMGPVDIPKGIHYLLVKNDSDWPNNLTFEVHYSE